jgi:hypothetical protein
MISKQRIKSKIGVLQDIDDKCEPPEDGSSTTSSLLLPHLSISQTSHRSAVQHHSPRVSLQIVLRHYATNRKVAGSIPDEVIGFFN